MHISSRALVLAVSAAILSACLSIDVVSEGPDGIAIAVEGQGDMDEASRRVARYCDDTDRQSAPDCTEAVGEDVIAYSDRR